MSIARRSLQDVEDNAGGEDVAELVIPLLLTVQDDLRGNKARSTTSFI